MALRGTFPLKTKKKFPAVGKHLPVNEHHGAEEQLSSGDEDRYNINKHNALELKKLLSAGGHLELK
ncbi:hypothetical protein ABVK25_011718 [Lepraria finkii]|uniref:Uncharacterized protein n=1 Tax=Lepraria finkii TaxID=1340010 RepID=A0ABR4ANB0_9LECA